MIERLHHAAYRCQNSAATRAFYEGFLGLPLVDALIIEETQTGRPTAVLHTFFGLPDGSAIAFFEAPREPFDFKPQHDFDLHLALKVAHADLLEMLGKAESEGIEHRGVSDHGFIHSVYFRDPNGYVVELAADVASAQSSGDVNQTFDTWLAMRSSL